MGWLMVSAVVEQCIKISPVQFSKTKLMEMGYPSSFLWPVFQDYDGAKMLVEAVMARNLDAIRMLNGRHPLADFGLRAWIKELETKEESDRALVVKVVKRQALPRGFSLEHRLEVNSVSGERRLLRVLLNGKQHVKTEVLKSETATAKDT